MRKMFFLALFTCSLHADPQDLLGKRLHDFAGKCKIKYSTDRSRGPMVCRVKGQPRYFGKIKISEEYLYFEDDRVVQVKVVPDSNMSAFDLDDLYGHPDPPLSGFEDHSALGVIDYTDGRESTTVDDNAVSRSMYFRWTKPTFTVMYTFYSYKSFDGIGFSDDEILFTSTVTVPPSVDQIALQRTRANSEAAKASPAAAAELANAGHVETPKELAKMVKKGLASRCAVITTPAGAEVSIDGRQLGISPLAFVLARHGDTPRTITIRLNGYKILEKKLVPDGQVIPLAVTLEKE